MNTSMLEVKNLSFSYGRRKAMVLEDFSLTLQKGSVYGLLGKNGTGKSTLLYLMSGLLRPQNGQVLYKGIEVVKRYPETLQDTVSVALSREVVKSTAIFLSYTPPVSPFSEETLRTVCIFSLPASVTYITLRKLASEVSLSYTISTLPQ